LTTYQRLQFLDTPEIRILARADGRELGNLRAGIFITSEGARTPWGNIDNVVVTARWLSASGTNSSAQAELNVKASAFESKSAKLQHTHFIGQFSFFPTNAAPAKGALQLDISRAETRWGKGRDAHISG